MKTLRELAEAARDGTHVPWFRNPIEIRDRAASGEIHADSTILNRHDAEFIAAANPSAVLALLDKLDAVRALHHMETEHCVWVDGSVTDEDQCAYCRQGVWPCETIRVLDGDDA